MSFIDKSHLTIGGIAAAVAVAGTLVAHQTIPVKHDVTLHAVAQKRVGKSEWPALSPQQIGELAGRFKAIGIKGDVVVFCASMLCKDLAQDIEEALAGAGVRTKIEVPVFDQNTGINVLPKGDGTARQIAEAIYAVTYMRVGEIDGALDQPGRVAIDISQKN